MRMGIFAFASLTALITLPGVASAQDPAAGAAAGAATGAITGAIVGGPVGAAVGAVAGGAIGGATSAPYGGYDAPAPVYGPGPVVVERRRVMEPTGTIGCRVITVRRYDEMGDLVVRKIRRCD